MKRRKRDHRFCRMDRHLSYLLKFINQLVKKTQSMFAFSIQKVVQCFIVAGMYLVGVDKRSVTKRAYPHGAGNC
jgi:vacuolar-type H+-ATPase subunit I/STV1